MSARRLLVTLLALGLTAALGLMFGLGVSAACPTGPISGVGRGLSTLLIGVLAASLVVIAVSLAILRRRGSAKTVLVFAAAGLAGGYAAGLTFGPGPQCPVPTEISTSGVGVLQLGDPYDTRVEGTIGCLVDRATGTLLGIGGRADPEGSPGWTFDSLGVEFQLATDLDRSSGSPFDLGLFDENRFWGYRATEASQIRFDGGPGLRASMAFRSVPLLEDTRPTGSPVPDSLDGRISWTCTTNELPA